MSFEVRKGYKVLSPAARLQAQAPALAVDDNAIKVGDDIENLNSQLAAIPSNSGGPFAFDEARGSGVMGVSGDVEITPHPTIIQLFDFNAFTVENGPNVVLRRGYVLAGTHEPEAAAQILSDPNSIIESVDFVNVADASGYTRRAVRIHPAEDESTGVATISWTWAGKLFIASVEKILGEPPASDVPAHLHPMADVTGLLAALNGKAALIHEHEISGVSGLHAALDGKAAVDHGHVIGDVTGLQTELGNRLKLDGTNSPTAAINWGGQEITALSGLRTTETFAHFRRGAISFFEFASPPHRTVFNQMTRHISNKALELGSVGDVQMVYSSEQTNPGLILGLRGSSGNYMLITDRARIGTDFGIAEQTRPTLIIHDGSADVSGAADFRIWSEGGLLNFRRRDGTGTPFQIGTNNDELRIRNGTLRIAHSGTLGRIAMAAGMIIANATGSSIGPDTRYRWNTTGIAFFDAAPVAQQAALTAADTTTPDTGDAPTDDLIANMRTRINELESKLTAYGLLAAP
jgi:hypothetical protein